jgi:hypothetical protein
MNKNVQVHYGTTIAAYITPDTAWIAADTKVNNINPQTSKVESSFKMNKIHEMDNIVYAFHGHPHIDYYDNRIFDAIKTMADCIKKEKDLNAAFELFNLTIINQLNDALKFLQDNNHPHVLHRYTNESFFGILMITFQNGYGEYLHRKYRFERVGMNIKATAEPQQITPEKNALLLLGSIGSASGFLTANPSYFHGLNHMIEKLVFLIDKEAKANPKEVGFPVDALIMTRESNQWYRDIKDSIKVK